MEALAVVATWTLALACALALGASVARFSRLTGPAYVRAAMWSGLLLLAAIAVLVNLWSALHSPRAAIAVVALCTVGAVTGFRVRLVVGDGHTRWRRPGLLVLGLAGAVLAVLAIGSTLAATHYDSGLYHLAAVRWASDFATVPGLANLQAPLGYSTPAFPLAALLSLGPLGATGYSALNGAFLTALVIDLLLRASSVRTRAGGPVSVIVTTLCLAIGLVFADLLVASPTTDMAVLVLIAASLAGYADALSSRRLQGLDVVVVASPLLLAISMRLQTAAFAVPLALVLVLLARRRGTARNVGRALVATTAIGVLLAAGVVARDFVLSGRVGFPLSLWTFDVPWVTEDAADLRRATIAIARDPGPGYMQTLGNVRWMPDWLSRQAHAWETWALVALLIAAAALAWSARHRGAHLRWRAIGLLAAPGLVYGATWLLVLPPTWRLAWGPLLATAASVCGWLWWKRGSDTGRLLRAALAGTVVLAVACVLLRYPAKPREVPSPPVHPVTLPSGLIIVQPDSGDQCWLTDPLCTPAAAPGLALRGLNVQDGFVRQPS